MAHEYSAENYDWDLTLRAAFDLLIIGKSMDKTPMQENLSMGFAALTGSMLLSFSAIESFSASVAFSLPNTEAHASFDFEAYRKARSFKAKMETLFSSLGHKIDWSQGLFQSVSSMQQWRNLVTHASPYRIEKTEIENTTTAASALHSSRRHKQYPRSVNVKTATDFYETAYGFVDLLKKQSGTEPRTYTSFEIGAQQ